MATNTTWTTKEKSYLTDAKAHEQACVQKYSNYANLACDQELKTIFNSNKKQEEEHLNTITQLLSGQIPSTSGSSSSSSSTQASMSQSSMSQSASSSSNQSSSTSSQANSMGLNVSDKDLCHDILDTEKYLSGTYNTAIFEFRDPQVRDILNHIQKDEQKHGENVYKYMESKGLYNPQ